jgi:4-hydroxythreonine-4-phosphate dehydrogenase
MNKPIVAGITVGDSGGVGPEIAIKAACQSSWPGRLRLVLIGNRDIIRREARRLRVPLPPTWKPSESPPTAPVSLWSPEPPTKLEYRPGTIRVAAARAAATWIRAAANACIRRQLDAMVTAPICKEGFHRAGIDFPGHTEMLANITHTQEYAMMLTGGKLRVVLATRHIPLARVPRAITTANIVTAGRLAAASLPWLGATERSIAVCGLNPHAGDGGTLGHEEARIIAPAIRQLRRRGIDAIGPLAADATFYSAARGAYGAVLAMYHDQGLGPLKTIAFDSGINITLGLPIIRTSPDHGTAFDIAGKGIANPLSMVNAIKAAYRLARNGNPWGTSETN